MTDNGPADIGKDGRRYMLTQRQEEFCRAVLENEGNASQAYRQIYGCVGWSDEAIWVKAAKAMAKAKVRQRVNQLQAKARERSGTTVDSITAKLAKAYEMGEKTEKSGAMTQAALGEAKLHGLLVDKHQDVTPPADLSDAQIEAELAAIRAELATLGTRH